MSQGTLDLLKQYGLFGIVLAFALWFLVKYYWPWRTKRLEQQDQERREQNAAMTSILKEHVTAAREQAVANQQHVVAQLAVADRLKELTVEVRRKKK